MVRYAPISHHEQPINCLEPRTVSFIKVHHGEPWRRHSTTGLQLNPPIEGVSVLPATTATKSASAKLRTSHFPGPGLDAVPSPWAPNSVLGPSTTPEVPECPRVWPQAQGPPEPAPVFPHLRLLSHPRKGVLLLPEQPSTRPSSSVG